MYEQFTYTVPEIKSCEILKKTGVYRILNIENDKEYIGSTSYSFIERWQRHIRDLKQNKHSNLYLQNAWNKYGELAFNFQILSILDKDQCLKEEQYWLDYSNCDYNICFTAASPGSRQRLSDFRLKKANNEFPGCYFNKVLGKYISSICIERKNYTLGYFNNAKEASDTYLQALDNYEKHGILPITVKKEFKYYRFKPESNKYIVRITINGVRKHLGYYDTEDQAIEVVKKYRS